MEDVKEIIRKYKASGADRVHITDVVKIIELLQKDHQEQLRICAVSQRSGLVYEHRFGDSYEQMGGGLTLHECEKCGIVQTCG